MDVYGALGDTMTTNVDFDFVEFLTNTVDEYDLLAGSANAKLSMFVYRRRKQLRMNKKQFAKLMGVSTYKVTRWESAEYNFTVEDIIKIYMISGDSI